MYLSYLKFCKVKKNSCLLQAKNYVINENEIVSFGNIETFKLFRLHRYSKYFPESKFFFIYFRILKLLKRYFRKNNVNKYYLYTIWRIDTAYFKHIDKTLNNYSHQMYRYIVEKTYTRGFLERGKQPHWLLMYIVRNYKKRLWRNFRKFQKAIHGFRYIFDLNTNDTLFYWYRYKYYLKFPFKGSFLTKINFFCKYAIYEIFSQKNYLLITSKLLCFFRDHFLSLFILKTFDFFFFFKKLWISKLFKQVKRENFYLFLLYRFSNLSLDNFNVYVKRRHWGRQNLPMFAQMGLIYNFIKYRGVFLIIGKYLDSSISMTFSGYRTPYIVTKTKKSFWRDITACFSLYSYHYFSVNSNVGYLMYPHLIKLNLFRNSFVDIGWSVATKIILGKKSTYEKFSYYYLNSKSLLISNFYFNGIQALSNINNYFKMFFDNYSDYTYTDFQKSFNRKKKPISMHRQEITSMRWIRENIKSFFIEKYKRAWFITRFCKYYEKSLTAGIQNLIWIEMRLSTILLRCKIVYLIEDSYNLIKGGCVFINGVVCYNVNYIVKLHDRIQFMLSKSLHLQHRELLSNALVKYKKLPAYVYSRYSGKNKFEMVHRDVSARWPLKALWVKHDIPRYLEVDYITMTIFVLYYPLYLKDIFPYYYLHIKFLSARCYNWRFFH